ncbi:MAG: hypothetical protein ABF946_12050, partial [Acetobacter papayae]
MTTFSRASIPIILTALLVALIGLGLTIGGTWLLSYGDTPYYLLCGLAMLASAVLLYRKKPAALWVYTAITLGSLLWA